MPLSAIGDAASLRDVVAQVESIRPHAAISSVLGIAPRTTGARPRSS
jgi:hypothetical protein